METIITEPKKLFKKGKIMQFNVLLKFKNRKKILRNLQTLIFLFTRCKMMNENRSKCHFTA